MNLITGVFSSVLPQFTHKELIQDSFKKSSLIEFEEDKISIGTEMPILFVPLIISGSRRVFELYIKSAHKLLLYNLKAVETCAVFLSCCIHKGENGVEFILRPLKLMEKR